MGIAPIKTVDCKGYIISMHCQRAIDQRDILLDYLIQTVDYGEIIAKYDDDKPFPSKLILKFVGNKPLHVVVAQHPGSFECILITAYWPDSDIWQYDFRNRINV
jgi:hypothetical protein